MNDNRTIQANTVSFKDFVWSNRRNRTILKLAALAVILQFTFFKYLYPFASFIHGDSFSYLTAARENLDINTYMVGYSRFLRLFSVFSTSDTVLVAFQYVLIQSSTLLLLFTIFFYYKPSRTVQNILLLLMVINPLYLHLANLISSDCIFATLSLIWFTLLLWIIHGPSNNIIVCQALVMFLAFTVRYNALIYPIITALTFYLAHLKLRKKIMGLSIGLILCGLFIYYTSYQYKKLTGLWQYSPFSGWQMANNAMCTYRYIDSANRKPVPHKFKKLDNLIRNYFDATRDTSIYFFEKIQASTIYMWSPSLPLMGYRNTLFEKDTSASELKKWATMGPFYNSYGLFIIRQYPLQFFRYFVWPNANKYYAPPVEFLKTYNSGKTHVPQETMEWFHYKNVNIKTRMKDQKVWILSYYPILSGMINVIMLFSLICFLILKGWKQKPVFKKGIIIASSIWLANAGFTIFASSAALRFQSFPIILTTIFVSLLVDWLWTLAIAAPSISANLDTTQSNQDLSEKLFADINQ